MVDPKQDPISPGVIGSSENRYRQERLAYWNGAASRFDTFKSWGGYYHRRLTRIYQNLIPPGLKVIEFGCGAGDLLAAIRPAEGVGVDFSDGMIQHARQRHPELRFLQADVHALSIHSPSTSSFSLIYSTMSGMYRLFSSRLPGYLPRTLA